MDCWHTSPSALSCHQALGTSSTQMHSGGRTTGMHLQVPLQSPVNKTTFPWYDAISVAVEYIVDRESPMIKKALPGCILGKKLESWQGGSLKFSWGRLGGVPIYLPLPVEVLCHIGICQNRQEAVKGCIDAQVVLRARSRDPHTGGGLSHPCSGFARCPWWLYCNLGASLLSPLHLRHPPGKRGN
jgi:hypothetical protein